MAQADYIPGSCNIGEGEINRRRIVAAIGFVLSLSALTTFITTDVSQSARLGIFIPLLVMSIGWVQSRKKFCLAYGFTGTFNFGKLGQISRVADPIARAADRRTALMIFAQSTLYAAVLTALVVALPL
ncbi:unannotated protein [freshwater metagenome]|uniref:Unannotated protein n=1 Tax=freshwater metagenome TaxID=449393 RepID=A0A6J7MNT8_9ZZZZ|nr:hypothetical protein [Actinomycetota bacterium]MSV70793.1 hypothetical protein [Actinomycetota bacterium]MSW13293.1 hypothetical protein [Actinomycetota bacterium]MSX47052.1 hypothetical protein [Actinomycetota bacterium]MSX90980.1 hypothetical protein [Actinomycetota bacterium]